MMGHPVSALDAANADASILVVDDDRDIRHLLARTLEDEGYGVTTAADTREMDGVLAKQRVDLVLLDVMMPGEDGISACTRITREGGPAVIFLSALGDELDRVTGLEVGAGHYLAKPCSAREVLATVRAALRARQANEPATRRRYLFAGWCVDIVTHELTDPDGMLVSLTDGEFSLLRSLVERPRRVLSRETLLEVARGPDTEAFDRAIDVQVSRVRRKLRAPGDDMIRTIRNEGYLFVPAVSRR